MPRLKKDATKEQKTETAVQVAETTDKTQKFDKIEGKFTYGTGRRKTAVARVFLWEEKGEFMLNGRPLEEYFPSPVEEVKWLKPFHLIGVSHPKAKYRASIKVQGSGKQSQLDAVVHGISRALAKISEEYHIALAKAGMMTRDPRMVERKKPFLHKARKRPQYSKR
jgi:small subunit ribosomal protein S9